MKNIRRFFLAVLFSALLLGAQGGLASKQSIEIEFLGRYVVPVFDEINEGVQICRKNGAESVGYDAKTQQLFVTNRTNLFVEEGQPPKSAITVPSVDVLNISDPTKPVLQFQIDVSDLCDDGDPETAPEPTSVAVHRGRVAVAVKLGEKNDEGEVVDETAPGCVAFFDAEGNFLNEVGVGSLPDMVTFTRNGWYVLTANEAEANDEYTIDPEGSVSIIDIRSGVEHAVVRTARFSQFNDRREELRDAGVRIFGPSTSDPEGATVAEDLEPEYIAVSNDSRTAYVTLEENNALAEVDIENARVTRIVPLGFKDHSLAGNELDASNEDEDINIRSWPVHGMYQPDAIAFFRTRGRTYVVTANEGDSRDKEGFSEEARIKDIDLDPTAFPDAGELQKDENLGRLKVTTALGDTDDDGDFDHLFAYGARSFSIWSTKGHQVFDSGVQFATLIAQKLERAAFNTADDKTDFDDRSDDKGVEPEGITAARLGRRWYAFTILERVGGIMAYDVTHPGNAHFVDYVNSRNFDQDAEVDDFFPDDYQFPVGLDENDFSKCNPGDQGPGDSAPEVILFIPKWKSPTKVPLLVVAHETTSSTAIYTINTRAAEPVSCGDTLRPGERLHHPLLDCDVFPALIIEGPGSFDLNGQTISCALPGDGTLAGAGIVVRGSGATVYDGTIENCDRGVVISGDGNHALRQLIVKSPDVTDDVGNLYNDGIAFHGLSRRNRFSRNKVTQYAGEGFRLDDASANENVLSFNVVSESANHAFRVSSGQDNLFLANVARDNTGPKGGKVQGEGFRSQDRGTKFIANLAVGNGDEGFRLRDAEATENLLIGNTAKANGLDPCDLELEDANPGIAVTRSSSNNQILRNTVAGNCLGIVVDTLSLGNRIAGNTALNNGIIDLADGNSNCDMNEWWYNEFKTSAVGPLFNEDPACIQ